MSNPPTPSSPDGKLPRRRFIAGVGGAAAGAAIGGAVVSSPAYAQPITYMPGFSGPANFAHGDTVTINGPGGTNQGFGTKPQASPIVWDDASGPANPLDKWTTAWPDLSVDPNHNMKRRPAHPGVNPPHSIVGRYLAGCHYGNGQAGPRSGYNVDVGKSWAHSGPTDLYASCWMRFDPQWHFAPDNNYKFFKWHEQLGNGDYVPIDGNGFSWVIPAGECTSISDTQFRLLVYTIDATGGNLIGYGSPRANPMAGWVKYEIETRFRTDSTGFMRFWENGKQILNYSGPLDPVPGPYVGFCFGHFARPYNSPDHWRYLTDCYLDNSLGRVTVNNTAMNVRELQYPTAWNDTSITFKVWRGVHGTLAGRSLYVKSARTTNNLIKVADIG